MKENRYIRARPGMSHMSSLRRSFASATGSNCCSVDLSTPGVSASLSGPGSDPSGVLLTRWTHAAPRTPFRWRSWCPSRVPGAWELEMEMGVEGGGVGRWTETGDNSVDSGCRDTEENTSHGGGSRILPSYRFNLRRGHVTSRGPGPRRHHQASPGYPRGTIGFESRYPTQPGRRNWVRGSTCMRSGGSYPGFAPDSSPYPGFVVTGAPSPQRTNPMITTHPTTFSSDMAWRTPGALTPHQIGQFRSANPGVAPLATLVSYGLPSSRQSARLSATAGNSNSSVMVQAGRGVGRPFGKCRNARGGLSSGDPSAPRPGCWNGAATCFAQERCRPPPCLPAAVCCAGRNRSGVSAGLGRVGRRRCAEGWGALGKWGLGRVVGQMLGLFTVSGWWRGVLRFGLLGVSTVRGRGSG